MNRNVLFKAAKKLLGFLLTMLVLSAVVFCFARLAPGDPLQSFYGDAVETMTAREQEQARERLGLNGSIPLQYVRWAGSALHGDFGLSLKYKMPAMDVISALLGNTLVLGGTAFVLVFALAVLLALFCAVHEDTLVDKIICKAGTAAAYIPPFWLGVVLILIFSINLRWLPGSGAYDVGMAEDAGNRLRHMVLPLTVMIFSHLWYYAYMIRNKLLDEVRKDYVLLAKSKGCGRAEIVLKHCLRNVAPTIVSTMAISIPHVLSGTYIAESVFNYPGIGALAVSSAKYHDYNLLMLVVLVTGVMVLVSSMIAQAVNEKIDPRMKAEEASVWRKPSTQHLS